MRPALPFYPLSMRVLHWLTAALLLFAYPLAWSIEHAQSAEAAARLVMLHRSIGVTVFLLTLIRLVRRMTSEAPPLPTDLPGWQHWAAQVNESSAVRSPAGAAVAWYTALEKRAALGQKETLKLPNLADDLERVPSKPLGSKPLERKLFALPLELRECLVLRELEGCSYKEISRIIETPIGTVMSRLWRARRTLMGFSKESES